MERLLNEVKNVYFNNSILKDWLLLKQNGVSISSWLVNNDINRIAIYGWGILGKALYEELKYSEVDIVCVVDKNNNDIFPPVDAVGLDDVPAVDAIIITPLNYYYKIEKDMSIRTNNRLISLEEILYGVTLNE